MHAMPTQWYIRLCCAHIALITLLLLLVLSIPCASYVKHCTQLFSVICPKVNFKATSNGHPSKGGFELNLTDTEVLVHEGELVMGCVDKKTVSTYQLNLYSVMM
jgi:hypothetical protein